MSWNQHATDLLQRLGFSRSAPSTKRAHHRPKRKSQWFRHEHLEQRMLLAADGNSMVELDVTLATPGVIEGSLVGGTASISEALAQPVEVRLTSSNPDEATVPLAVTIPAGELSASFIIETTDDNVVDAAQNVIISAETDFDADSTLLIIANDDIQSGPFIDFAINGTVTDAGSVNVAEGDVLTVDIAFGAGFATEQQLSLDFSIAQVSQDDLSDFGLVSPDIILEPGQTTASFTVEILEDNLVEGLETLDLIVRQGDPGVLGSAQADVELLIGDGDQTVPSLQFEPSVINENGGVSRGTIRLSTPVDEDVTFELGPLPDGIVSSEGIVEFPSTVTVPAFATSATFEVIAIDNEVESGPSGMITIVASNEQFGSSRDAVVVEDDESATLSAVLSDPAGIAEGGFTFINFELSVARTFDTVINVGLPTNGELFVPQSGEQVTIPAGSLTASLPLFATADGLVDGDQTLQVAVTANAIDGFSIPVTTLDVDGFDLELTVDTNEITESTTATGTLSVTTASATDVVVFLDSDDTEVNLPAQVVIPAFATSVDFTISGTNDVLVDGDQLATISAVTDEGANASFALTVIDIDTASLVIDLPTDQVAEGDTVAAAISVTTPLTVDTIVAVTVNDSSQASVQTEVIIPAFATRIELVVAALDDDLVDGNQIVTITATSSFDQVAATLTVVDNDEAIAATSVTGVTLADDGTLLIVGSDGIDVVTVTRVGQEIRVGARFDSGSSEGFVFDANEVVDLSVTLGEGNDGFFVPTTFDLDIEVDGGAGNDMIFTGSGNDQITDLTGSNQIFARGGDDRVLSGDGNDAINGGSGNDVIEAGNGANRVVGGSGNDVIITGSGNDTVSGGSGNDAIAGGGGFDRLFGSTGRDILIGGSDSDLLAGSSGGDLLIGGTTAFDEDADALGLLLAVWGSDESLDDRVETLQSGSGILDGIQLINGETVIDDQAADAVFGGLGSDPDLLFSEVV